MESGRLKSKAPFSPSTYPTFFKWVLAYSSSYSSCYMERRGTPAYKVRYWIWATEV